MEQNRCRSYLPHRKAFLSLPLTISVIVVLTTGLLCRELSDKSDWAGVPHHLLGLISCKVHKSAPSHSILGLREMCKAWRDAVSEYPGSAELGVYNDCSLERLCKILPALCELTVTSYLGSLNLHPISTLTQLVSLSLGLRSAQRSIELDLALLPSSLQSLSVRYCPVWIASFASLKCVALTRLVLVSTTRSSHEVIKLLEHLPKLRVG